MSPTPASLVPRRRRTRRFAAACLTVLALAASTDTLRAQSWTQWPTSSGGNGHWYLAVRCPGGIRWAEANTKAQALGGHLATITSAAENTFVYSLVVDPIFWQTLPNPVRTRGPWLGGFQPAGSVEPLGSWSWVTGESWGYTHWAPGEPNQAQGNQEDHLHFYAAGTVAQPTWNDLRQNQFVPGFVVESPNPPLASYLTLGTGCASTGQAPTLLPATPGLDLPRVGSTSLVRIGNLPTGTNLVVLAIGRTNRYADLGGAPTPLPTSLDFAGWPACTLQVDPQIVLSAATSGPTVDHAVGIPPVVSLIGESLFLQAAALTATDAVVSAWLAGFVGP